MITNRKERARNSVRRADRITRWLSKAGFADPKMRAHVAVDISDSIDAMDWIQHHLSALLRADPSSKIGLRRAQQHASALGTWWSSELKYHVIRLHRSWESKVEDPLYSRRIRKARRKAGTKSR